MKKLNENRKITLTVGQIKRLIRESVEARLDETAEDDWLDGYLKDHPDALDSTIEWIKKTKPGMKDDGVMAWARNILKKKHRDGKIDPEHPTAVEPKPEKAPSATTKPEKTGKKESNKIPGLTKDGGEIRSASPEDEEKFVNEIEGYGNYKETSRWLKKEDDRHNQWGLKNGDAHIYFYKPVGFGTDGKLLMDIYPGEKGSTKRSKDGDWDDGREQEWWNVSVEYHVNPSKKIGEAEGEIKDKKVVLSDGTVLIGWSDSSVWSWTEGHEYGPSTWGGDWSSGWKGSRHNPRSSGYHRGGHYYSYGGRY